MSQFFNQQGNECITTINTLTLLQIEETMHINRFFEFRIIDS